MKSSTALTIFALLASAAATTFRIGPGDDFEVDCLFLVAPGDECLLLDGNHKHDGLTRTHGREDARITIRGESDEACIKGSGTQDRVLQIAHNWYTIKDLCFNGSKGDDEYSATAIYVLGGEFAKTSDEAHGLKSSVTGTQMFNLDIKNFGEECIHLRYFVTFTEIKNCIIQNCGKSNFQNGGGAKVGEGVYIGTAVGQINDHKAPEIKLRSDSSDDGADDSYDVTQKNWIHNNFIHTNGNECVECKEASKLNLIEDNICQSQKDEKSGCFGSRGSDNTFRNNDISNCVGSGFRVGGDGPDGEYGFDNNMYDNTISNARASAFNLMDWPQGTMCGNKISDVGEVFTGEHKNELVAGDVTRSCEAGESPGDIEEFNTARVSGGQEDDDDAVVVSGDEQELVVDNVVEIETNTNAGGKGQGGCNTVLSVLKVEVDHYEQRDEDTSPDNLFDGDVETYFSVNRVSTFFILELEEETVVSGVSIGFFMKDISEERFQKFDVAIRANTDTEYTTVISGRVSSGAMFDVQRFDFTSPDTARYIKFTSDGNEYNGWTAITEFEVCGLGVESNTLFSAALAAKKEVAELAGEVCAESKLLAPVTVWATGEDNVKYLFDDISATRWGTKVTQAENDLDNGKIVMMFLGDQHVSHVDIAFFDGHLSRQHFSLYKRSTEEDEWTLILDDQIVSKTDLIQTFNVEEVGVNHLSIVAHGNDIGNYSKISEIRVYGC